MPLLHPFDETEVANESVEFVLTVQTTEFVIFEEEKEDQEDQEEISECLLSELELRQNLMAQMGLDEAKFSSFFPSSEENQLPSAEPFPEASPLSSSTYPIYQEVSSLASYLQVLRMELEEIKEKDDDEEESKGK